MPVPAQPNLSIYVMSVGQADTQIVRTPQGRIVVIDAVKPAKIKQFLHDLGLTQSEPIDELILTHPHSDHYSGADGLLEEFGARSVTLSPFWHDHGWGSNGYRVLVNRLEADDIPVQFVSGYNRVYPDDLIQTTPGATASSDPVASARADVPFIEILGPSNSLVRPIEKKSAFATNHLSIMVRLVWNGFSMVFAGDAQMENWADFDREGMIIDPCRVLSAAHHGSKNGTQWERLQILDPSVVVVSSTPLGGHHIPDAIGCAIFREYEEKRGSSLVTMTHDTGTIEIEVRPTGTHNVFHYGEDYRDDVDLTRRASLTRANNPTDWDAELARKLHPTP